MRPEDLEDAMEGQAPDMNDVWREAIGPYAAVRAFRLVRHESSGRIQRRARHA